MFFKLSLLVIALVVASVESRPEHEVKIVRYNNDVRPDGYDFGFETSDGIRREENAVFQPISKEEGILSVKGESQYPLANGVLYFISFNADDKGYRPKYIIGEGASGKGGKH